MRSRTVVVRRTSSRTLVRTSAMGPVAAVSACSVGDAAMMTPIGNPRFCPVPAVLHPPLVWTPTTRPSLARRIPEPEFPPSVSMLS